MPESGCAYPYCDNDESQMHGYCSEACLDKGADLLRDLDAWGDLPDEEDGDPGFPSLEGADEWLW